MHDSRSSLSQGGLRSDRRRFIAGWPLRLLIAFIISWLLALALFVSGAISH